MPQDGKPFFVGAIQDLSRQLRAPHLNTTISAVKRRSLSYPKTKPSLVAEWTLSCADRHAAIAAQIEDLRSEFPLLNSIDETWIAETHDNRTIVLFEPLVHGRGYAPVYTFNGDTLLHAASG